MRIIVNFKNDGRETLDFIELTHPVTGVTATLDWDETNLDDGNLEGRGVHIRYGNVEESDEETDETTYGNDRINELKNMVFSNTQGYNLDTCVEREDVEVTSILIDDNGNTYQVPLNPPRS